MPVKVSLRNGKYRVVEAKSGRIPRTARGVARDGGGHRSLVKAQKQARAINSSYRRGR